MGRNDIVYVDPVGATIKTRSEKVRAILFLLESTPIEPPRCLACKKPAEWHMGLRIEEYASVIFDLPFCGSCKEKLEDKMETMDPMRFHEPSPPPPEEPRIESVEYYEGDGIAIIRGKPPAEEPPRCPGKDCPEYEPADEVAMTDGCSGHCPPPTEEDKNTHESRMAAIHARAERTIQARYNIPPDAVGCQLSDAMSGTVEVDLHKPLEEREARALEANTCGVCGLDIENGCICKPEELMDHGIMLGLESPPDDGRMKDIEEKVAGIMLEYPQGNWEPSDEKCPKCDTLMDYKSGHMPRYHCPQCDHELEV